MGAQSMELTTSDRPAAAVVDIRVGACRAQAQGGVLQVTVRRSEPFAHHSWRWTAPWAPVVRTVLGLLLILSSGSVGRAVDRVRVETSVDKAVAALGVSGAGVMVAILDRGIDWESNDFRNKDGTTRIAYIFDMCDEAGADDVENSYGRGTIYTRRQIDRARAAGTTLATRDAFGHGTTTTGIAAGNGRNSLDRKYRGVAPNATIIAVKIVGGEGGNEPDCWAGHSGISVAMDFVVDKSRELAMPVVMLANVGSIGGPTDGTSALARKIDVTVGPDRPGVVFVTGTGDDGVPSKTQNRAAGDVPNGGTLDLRFALDTGAGYLEVWYDRNQGFDVSVITPAGRLGPVPSLAVRGSRSRGARVALSRRRRWVRSGEQQAAAVHPLRRRRRSKRLHPAAGTRARLRPVRHRLRRLPQHAIRRVRPIPESCDAGQHMGRRDRGSQCGAQQLRHPHKVDRHRRYGPWLVR